MFANYHTHICQAPLAAMAAAAERAGLRTLGVSEHLYQIREGRALYTDPPSEGRIYELEDYVNQVRWTAAPGVQLRLAVEVDFLPGREAEVAAFLDGAAEWDYVIGSVHRVGGYAINTHHPLGLTEGWRVWRAYAAAQLAAVETGLYDVLAHPVRLARRLSPPPYLGDLLAEVAERAARRGMAIEINTPDVAECPAASTRLVEICRRAGVRVTLGSDAHRPQEIARHFDRAAALLRSHGFAGLTGFRARRAVPEPLPASARRRRNG